MTSARIGRLGRCVGVGLLAVAAGCAHSGGHRRVPVVDTSDYASDFEAAVEAKEVELPKRARSVADIRLISRAMDVAIACIPGRNPAYPISWLEDNRELTVHTSTGDMTVGEVAKACQSILETMQAQPIEACGARYVQLERLRGADDSFGQPRVARTSDGWYMTPCDRTPGKPAGRDLKEADSTVREACEDDKANLYMLARWSEGARGDREVATVACFSPRKERKGWLPGNPALGLK